MVVAQGKWRCCHHQEQHRCRCSSAARSYIAVVILPLHVCTPGQRCHLCKAGFPLSGALVPVVLQVLHLREAAASEGAFAVWWRCCCCCCCSLSLLRRTAQLHVAP